jgi:hypothetical protein
MLNPYLALLQSYEKKIDFSSLSSSPVGKYFCQK